MVAKLHSLAAAYVLALALVTEVFGQNQCTTVRYKKITGTPYNYPQVLLPPYQHVWKVTLQSACPYGLNGLLVTACDFDSPPSVVVQDDYTVYVTRTGQVQGDATLNIIAFCNNGLPGPPKKLVLEAEPVIPKLR